MDARQDGVGQGAGRSGRWGWIAVLAVAVATALVVAIAGYGALALLDAVRGRGATLGGGGATSTEVGGRAPEIAVTDLAGRQVRLSDFRGRTVLLNFRTTWCGYCRAEAPALQQAHERLGDLAVVAVYVGEGAGTVEGFAATEGLSFPMYIDDGAAAQEYGVRGIPASFFIDDQGVIFARQVGSLTFADIERYVTERG